MPSRDQSEPQRRFPPPWTVEQSEDVCTVRDANGVTIVRVYSRDDLRRIKWGNYMQHLSSDEARRIAKAIARLPELLADKTNR